MTSRSNNRIVVLKGGPSAEREVSLSSGSECASALRSEGFEVIEIDAGDNLVAQLRDAKPDVVFNALHGRWGEDGCVQGLLEWLKIPYTHSGVLASALAMDKERSKIAFERAGLPIVDSLLIGREDAMREHPMRPPYVVKPNNEGSSVGIYLVNESANGPAQLDSSMPDIVMVEKYVAGFELTTAVMDGKALTVTDIQTSGWYDYDAKYVEGGSTHVIPADIPKDIFDACMDYAERAHKVLGCRGVSRTDFRWDDQYGLAGLVLLEINTQPGMTPTSLAPEQGVERGISFGAMCRWLVEDASCNR